MLGLLLRAACHASVPLAVCGAALVAPHAALAQAADGERDPRVVDARKMAMSRYPTCKKMEPRPADVEAAGTAHQSAKKAVEEGKFSVAVSQWTLAYSFDCSRPSVFLNLARAYGPDDPAMGIAVMEIYLAREPGVDPVPHNKEIAQWRAVLGPPPVVEKSTPVGGKVIEPTKDVETKRPFGPGPWILFGVGAAAAIGGAVTLALGRVDVADAEEQCGGHTNCTQEQIDLGNGGNTLTGVGAGLLGGGVAIAVGGLIWQFVGNKPVASSAGNEKQADGFLSPSVTFDPSFGPGWAGGTLRGAF